LLALHCIALHHCAFLLFIIARFIYNMFATVWLIGLLTDIAKEALPYLSPFRLSGISSNSSGDNGGDSGGDSGGGGYSGDSGDSRLTAAVSIIPPPPRLPSAVSPRGSPSSSSSAQSSAQSGAAVMQEQVEAGAQEQWEELRAVQYSEALDRYMGAYASSCVHARGRYLRGEQGKEQGKERESWCLPLRVLLELFAVPGLMTVHVHDVHVHVSGGGSGEAACDEDALGEVS
jgi:hypothetical protein